MFTRMVQHGLMHASLTAGLLLSLLVRSAHADQVIHRYEGNVVPYDASQGWIVGDACSPPCSESLQDGHFVTTWTVADDSTNYHRWIAQSPEQPPPTLWVEWRFRSNHAIGTIFTGCDASFVVDYVFIHDLIDMYGDTAIGGGGGRGRGFGPRSVPHLPLREH